MGDWDYRPGDPIVSGLRAWAPLGGGRRCQTWLAWSTARWSPVVVKLPRPDLVGNAETLADLRQEAEISAGLAHPAVQRVYEARLDAPLPYLVTEYVEGPTLGAAIATGGPFEPGEAVHLGMQVTAALRCLHGSGVVHLDVKPSNICLRDGRPVLLDFGIARRAGEPRRAGAPRGSPPYMAPEQCRDEPAQPSTDLFALGAVLYEAATGALAFHPHRTGDGWEYPQLCGVPESLPGLFGALVTRLLDGDPARRPADADTVLGLLGRALPPDEESLWPQWVHDQ